MEFKVNTFYSRMLNHSKQYKKYESDSELPVKFSAEVLDELRKNVGRLPAETGGMLVCREDMGLIDEFHYEDNAAVTGVSYSYDPDWATMVYRNAKAKGHKIVGFIHSHPESYRQPSFSDVATSWRLAQFFGVNRIYIPIVFPQPDGNFTLMFFEAVFNNVKLIVELLYELKATDAGYVYSDSNVWKKSYNVKDLEIQYCEDTETSCSDSASNDQSVKNNSRANSGPIDRNVEHKDENLSDTKAVFEKAEQLSTDSSQSAVDASKDVNNESFSRLAGVYPKYVLDNKVIVVVGLGGSRSLVENLARNGFKNFILVDGDKVSATNIATQGVYLSEIGMYKAEAIRKRILDINPEVNIVCVNRFLDDYMSDEEFKSYMDMFPDRKTVDYLFFGCCDSFLGNKRAANLSLKYGAPYISAGVYAKGLAAELCFTYPGVTSSCPRCMCNSRYEQYENGFKNDVTSAGCTNFATERFNSILGFVALMLLMYHEAPESPYNDMLDQVKDRNFVMIRMSPYLASSELGIRIFDRVFNESGAGRYTFMDETLWIPQHPNAPEFGENTCKLCGGVGDLRKLFYKWPDTRIT